MIEILIVIAGAASAGGWGSLAWWTSTRHHDRQAVVLASRVVGCHPRGPKSAVRVIPGEIISESTSAPVPPDGARVTGGGQVCHGRLLLHEDGRTECHGGLDTCWGAGPHRGAPEACASQSHGCGVCQTTGRAS